MTDPLKLSLRTLGTVTMPATPQAPSPARVVIQRAGAINATHSTPDGTRVQLRAHVIPHDPKTPPQLQQRARFAAATAAYRLASPASRAAAAATAKRYRLPLWHAWVKDWLARNPTPPLTDWDGGPTEWDTTPVILDDGATDIDNAATDLRDPDPTDWDDGSTDFPDPPTTDWDDGSTTFS